MSWGGAATGGSHDPGGVAPHRHTLQVDGSAVHVVILATHLAAETALSHHVGALPSEHLLCGEADGRARKSAQLTVAAVHLPEAVLFPHLTVHNTDVEGDGNALSGTRGVTPTLIFPLLVSPLGLGAVDSILRVVLSRDGALEPCPFLVEAEGRHPSDFHMRCTHLGEAHS